MSDADPTPPSGIPDPDTPVEPVDPQPVDRGAGGPVDDLPTIVPATPDTPSEPIPDPAWDPTVAVPATAATDVAPTDPAATTVLPAAGVAATAGGQPPATGDPTGPGTPVDVYPLTDDDDIPWYKRPGPLAAAIVGGLAAIGLLIFAIVQWTGDDDPTVIVITDSSSTTTTLEDPFTSEATSTVELTTTTTSSTTTSTSTTVVETTTTPAPTTTAAPPSTTAAPAVTTTVPDVVVPPQPGATIWDVIVNSPDLSSARDLYELAGLDVELDDPDAIYTAFVPSNDAVELAATGVGAPDFGDADVVRNILLAALHEGSALQADEIVELASVDVLFGGPQVVNAAADPPTIGGAAPVVVDIEASNGVFHVVDMVLTPVT